MKNIGKWLLFSFRKPKLVLEPHLNASRKQSRPELKFIPRSLRTFSEVRSSSVSESLVCIACILWSKSIEREGINLPSNFTMYYKIHLNLQPRYGGMVRLCQWPETPTFAGFLCWGSWGRGPKVPWCRRQEISLRHSSHSGCQSWSLRGRQVRFLTSRINAANCRGPTMLGSH